MKARPRQGWRLWALALAWPAGLFSTAAHSQSADAPPVLVPAPLLLRVAAGLRLQAQEGQLQLLDDASGMPLRRWPLPAASGQGQGRALALLWAAQRRSFVIVPAGVPQYWELSYDPQAPPIYAGLVHDYRLGEGLAEPGYLGLRRAMLEQPLSAACLLAGRPWLLGQQGADAVLIHLDVRRVIATLPNSDARSATLYLQPQGPALLRVQGRSGEAIWLDTQGWKPSAAPAQATQAAACE